MRSVFELMTVICTFTLGIPWYIKPEPISVRAVPASPNVIHL
jgi:hypothetical protein